jgi:hypothetical protein
MRREPNGPRLFFATALAVNIMGHADIDVTHAVPSDLIEVMLDHP